MYIWASLMFVLFTALRVELPSTAEIRELPIATPFNLSITQSACHPYDLTTYVTDRRGLPDAEWLNFNKPCGIASFSPDFVPQDEVDRLASNMSTTFNITTLADASDLSVLVLRDVNASTASTKFRMQTFGARAVCRPDAQFYASKDERFVTLRRSKGSRAGPAVAATHVISRLCGHRESERMPVCDGRSTTRCTLAVYALPHRHRRDRTVRARAQVPLATVRALFRRALDRSPSVLPCFLLQRHAGAHTRVVHTHSRSPLAALPHGRVLQTPALWDDRRLPRRRRTLRVLLAGEHRRRAPGVPEPGDLEACDRQRKRVHDGDGPDARAEQCAAPRAGAVPDARGVGVLVSGDIVHGLCVCAVSCIFVAEEERSETRG